MSYSAMPERNVKHITTKETHNAQLQL